MRSNNPIFNRSEGFNGQTNAYGNPTYPGNGAAYQGYGQPQAQTQYGDPSTWDMTRATEAPQGTRPRGRMTIDSVVQVSGLTLGLVIVTALATWVLTGDINDPANAGTLNLALMVGAGGAFVLSLVNSFKRVISPALVLAFAVLEGVALGAISKFFWNFYDGAVPGAVVGTMAAFAGTLMAYKFLGVRVSSKVQKFVVAAVFGMIGLGLMELVLTAFGAQIGLFGVSGLGMVTAVIGLVLGVVMLMMDFQSIEQGIAAGLDERESWRAAFGITVSLVWIYTNLLRIMAFFNQD